MRIFKIGGKLVEEIGYVTNQKVVLYKYLRDEDKDKCPHCDKPIEIQHDIVEGCLNWDTSVEGVDTVHPECKNI